MTDECPDRIEPEQAEQRPRETDEPPPFLLMCVPNV